MQPGLNRFKRVIMKYVETRTKVTELHEDEVSNLLVSYTSRSAGTSASGPPKLRHVRESIPSPTEIDQTLPSYTDFAEVTAGVRD